MYKELGHIAQGWKDTEKETATIFFLDKQQIKQIPEDRTVMYAWIVVDYRPQKKDPNRVRFTVSGNLIHYPGDVATRTADLTTSKLLWNSVLSGMNACASLPTQPLINSLTNIT
eukprot:15356632-Ditylum_brightwellii.AAC.1